MIRTTSLKLDTTVTQEPTRSHFELLLDAMELAAARQMPAKHGYAQKRRAVLEYVEWVEAKAAILDKISRELRDANAKGVKS
jgi:hypothetical protein